MLGAVELNPSSTRMALRSVKEGILSQRQPAPTSDDLTTLFLLFFTDLTFINK
jgi:hypothetical protein